MADRLSSILKLEVPVIVQISTRMMAVKDVLSLAPGAIIELPKLADEELEIMVNNKPIGLGTAVKLGENFGIRITYVGNLKARIDALGANTQAGDAAAAGSATAARSGRRSHRPSWPQSAPPAQVMVR